VVKHILKNNDIEITYLCTNKSIQGLGRFLIGLVIFIYRKTEYNRLLLEIDQGYMNVGGYCLYRKMGFIVDETLYNQKPYIFDPLSLPMRWETKEDYLNGSTDDILCKLEHDVQIEAAIKMYLDYMLKNFVGKKKETNGRWKTIMKKSLEHKDMDQKKLQTIVKKYLIDKFAKDIDTIFNPNIEKKTITETDIFGFYDRKNCHF